jgi:hypothetical protein
MEDVEGWVGSHRSFPDPPQVAIYPNVLLIEELRSLKFANIRENPVPFRLFCDLQ